MKITDEKLYKLCKLYGERARFWRQKFIGLLPEVFKRELYKKHGFSSIFEFSAKLAGVSEEQVRRALNLEKRFVDKPILKNLLENGEVSVNKLARIASVVTAENQEFWALQAKNLPQNALEVLVKDEGHLQNQISDADSVRAHTKTQSLFQSSNDDPGSAISGLKLSSKVTQKLLELQQKGIDINQLLLKFLEKRELEIAQEKEKLSAEILVKNPLNARRTARHISAKIRRILKQEHGKKCSISTCNREAKIIHHTQRFALGKNHNPHFLAPLCREHHAIAHSIDLKFNNSQRRGKQF